MGRKVFLGVGSLTMQDVLEVLKPEHEFDLVVYLTDALDVQYLGTSDGLELECKQGERVGSVAEWFERHVSQSDVVFAKITAELPNDLPITHKLVGGSDVGTWLHDIRVTLPKTLTLIYASYGSPEQSADVTSTIKQALESPMPSGFQVTNSFLGCDPHYGVGKMLSIHYEIDGATRHLDVWEGDYFLVA
jgi:hypothetical protein